MDLFQYNSLIEACKFEFYILSNNDFCKYLKNITYLLSQYSLQQDCLQSLYFTVCKQKYPHNDTIQ